MSYDDIKQQLMDSMNEIVEAIKNDKVLEIRRDNKNGVVQIFEIKKKKLK